MKPNLRIALFFALMSFSNLAFAQDSLEVDSYLSELKLAHYGQSGCPQGKCPNISVEIVPGAQSGDKDSLIIKMNIEPAGCNGGFMFKNTVSEMSEYNPDDSTTYRYFDSISRNAPASPCMAVPARTLSVSKELHMSAGRTRLRFLQSNRQYTEVSYDVARENGINRIKDLKIENNK